MLQGLYDWTLKMSQHRNAERSLAAMCFAESSFLPAMPEVMLLPMILADRTRAWRLAFVCTLWSVLGGILGYFIGVFLFESVGEPLLAFYRMTGSFERIAEDYNDLGWLMVLIGGGITPVPYKVITILSGVTRLDFAVFVGMSVVARSIRFYIPCALLYYFGPQAKVFLEKRMSLVFWSSLALIVGGTLLAGYIL
ncbi:YqaA family protein [Aureimonas mangrovi]|uniref:YqaA family protein n=1 Tax=Aureimonas mangrovi TaxID=2758041 RepID=UPI00163D4CDD|nr:YqaA family protein [Aureimonas mangrovi]